MKRTEIERRQRELKRSAKKEQVLERKSERSDMSVGDFISTLVDQLYFSADRILDPSDDMEIFELLEDAASAHPDKLDTIITKAVRKTKVKERDEAVMLLKAMME